MIDNNTSNPKYLEAYFLKNPNLPNVHQAVIEGDSALVKILLEAGESVNSPDQREWTPLHHAVVMKNQAMQKLLKTYGADPNIQNDTGASPKDFVRFLKKVKMTSDLSSIIFKPYNVEQIYEEATQSHYISDQYVSSLQLINEWHQKPFKQGRKFAGTMGSTP